MASDSLRKPGIYYNKAFVGAWLAESQDLRSTLYGLGVQVATMYMSELPVRSGRLKAATKHPVLGWSDHKGDRPMVTIENSSPYAVWNLTGAGPGMHTRSTGNMPKFGPFKGDYTFTRVIRQLRRG